MLNKDSKILNVPFVFSVHNKGCVLACVEMILKYYNQKFDSYDMSHELVKHEEGISMLDVVLKLKKFGYFSGGGFTDDDITLGAKNFNELKLENVYNNIHKNLMSSYQEAIEVMENNKNFNIHTLTLGDIKNSLEKNEPIIVNLLSGGKNEFMHSVCIIGYNKKDIIILNPPTIGKEYVLMETFFNLHQKSGGYYMYIKRRSIQKNAP